MGRGCGWGFEERHGESLSQRGCSPKKVKLRSCFCSIAPHKQRSDTQARLCIIQQHPSIDHQAATATATRRGRERNARRSTRHHPPSLLQSPIGAAATRPCAGAHATHPIVRASGPPLEPPPKEQQGRSTDRPARASVGVVSGVGGARAPLSLGGDAHNRKKTTTTKT
jgi:hypothetical protein